MRKFWKQLGKAICYFLLYFGVQNILGIVYMVIYIFKASFEAAAIGMMPDAEGIALGAMDFLLQSQNSLVIISGIITILFLLLFFLIRKKNLLVEANVTKTSMKNVIVAMGLGISMMLTVSFGLSLLPESWLEAYSAQSNMLVMGSPLAIIVSTMVMAPLIEELIFRGLMLSRLRKGMSDTIAIVICSLIFGLAHGQIIWMIYAFVLGVVLSLVAVKTDSLLPGIILHMVFNICGVVVPILLGDIYTKVVCIVLFGVGIVLTAVLLTALLKKRDAEKDTLQTV